jgi:hypothetical protein
MALLETKKVRAARDLSEYKDKHDPASDEFIIWGFSQNHGIPPVVLGTVMGLDAVAVNQIQRATLKLPPAAWPRYERLCAAVQVASEFELFPIDPNKTLSTLALCDAVATLEKKLQAYEGSSAEQTEPSDA